MTENPTLKPVGVSRMGDNDKAILVSFDRKLTDDELKRFHHWLLVAAHKVAENLTMATSPKLELVTESRLVQTDPGHWESVQTQK